MDVLINNAGFGLYGAFLEIPWERERAMLELDIVTLTHLTKLFVKDMVERRFGYVLLVASIGAYQPSPTYATYSAAKSYVLFFGEALHYELRKTGVNVTVVSPGVTKTEFLDVAGQQPSLYQRTMMMASPDVTRIAVDALLKGKASVVPGYKNAALAQSTRLMPRQLAAMSCRPVDEDGQRRLATPTDRRCAGPRRTFAEPVAGQGGQHGPHRCYRARSGRSDAGRRQTAARASGCAHGAAGIPLLAHMPTGGLGWLMQARRNRALTRWPRAHLPADEGW